MAQMVSQGPCPSCGGRGYTTYADGGYHCFSCGMHSNGSGFIGLAERLSKPKEVAHHKDCLPLPEDVRHLNYMPAGQQLARNWCRKYGITDREIDEHHFCWSTKGTPFRGVLVPNLLIFPVYDAQGTLLMWQARSFDTSGQYPKYLTRGKKETVLHLIHPENKSAPYVILTEDLISAIKVGRQFPAMPLWGSSLSKEVVQRIATQFERAYLWLDYDKRDYAIKASFEHCMRLHITPIITELDPKCYSDEEIKIVMQRDYTDD